MLRHKQLTALSRYAAEGRRDRIAAYGCEHVRKRFFESMPHSLGIVVCPSHRLFQVTHCTTSIMADVQAVLQALDALNKPTNKAAFAAANAWLQDFQHSVNSFVLVASSTNG